MTEQVQIEAQEQIHSTVKTTERVDDNAVQIDSCAICANDIDSVSEVDVEVLNPTFTYEPLAETLNSVTWYRLRDNVKNEDLFLSGEHLNDPSDASTEYTYSKEQISEQIGAGLSLNAWHGFFESHKNAPSLHSDTVNLTCKNCAEKQVQFDEETFSIRNTVQYNPSIPHVALAALAFGLITQGINIMIVFGITLLFTVILARMETGEWVSFL